GTTFDTFFSMPFPAARPGRLPAGDPALPGAASQGPPVPQDCQLRLRRQGDRRDRETGRRVAQKPREPMRRARQRWPPVVSPRETPASPEPTSGWADGGSVGLPEIVRL